MGRREARLRALENQIRRLNGRLTQLHHKSDHYSRTRLAIFLLGGTAAGTTLVTWGAWQWAVVSALFLIPFAVAVFLHRQVEESIRRHEIWLRLKRTQVARMRLDWEHIPATLPIPPGLEHPFALDLDLVGERSLHQLLDTAVSHEGSQRLRDWLLDATYNPDRIAERRALVEELTRLPLFRDKLRLNGTLATDTAAKKWLGQRLLDWLDSHTDGYSLRPILLLLALLAVVNVVLFSRYLAGAAPGWGPGVSWFLYAAVSLTQFNKTSSLFQDASFLADGLRKLGTIFHFLENYRYTGARHLRALCAPFLDQDNRPSQQLKRVARVVSGASLHYNPVLAFFLNAIVPWDIYFAYRMEQCQRELAALLPAWLDVWFELEALNSLANFAYLNPDAIFPELVEDVAPFLFEARALGHPLIPGEQRICNDFTVPELGAIYIVTGSNMAGKSTFLRTLGVNVCLAMAGAPVAAQSLRTVPFRLFSAIRVTDSVTDGFSYFYAEVRRLQALLAELERVGKRPLLFLIDEIFRGTNNRERLIGSRAYIRALTGNNGAGVIATHDLELVKLADETPAIRNYHFRDDVQDGRMVFDYKLHPGPCPTTNALKIMRLAGLPVGKDEG